MTLNEAVSWLERSGNLAIFCEAHPWAEPDDSDLRATHIRQRSFAVNSGAARARVTAVLVGVVSGTCPHLSSDSMCTIYQDRPLVCRIYPAEISPFIELKPERKACPPEAWQAETPLSLDSQVVDVDLRRLIDESRHTDYAEAPDKARLCNLLGIDVAALAAEGFAAHEPDRAKLLAALRACRGKNGMEATPWRIYSRHENSVAELGAKGFETLTRASHELPFTFLHSPH